MEDQPKPNVTALELGHPLSGLPFPPGHCFAQDREGIEARILMVGHAQRVAELVIQDAPIETIREQARWLIEAITHATHREILLFADAACDPKN